jgi:Holliday junction resolvasome RuvABC endonuclease subunit
MDNYINILAIDPGNNIGVAILTIDVTTFTIVNIETKLYVLENLVDYQDDNRNRILLKLSRIHSIVIELFNSYNPAAFAIETSFLNSRFPKAVIQLSQYVGMIEHSFYTCNPYIKLFRYMPKYIKKLVSGRGDADKDGMTVAIRSIPELITHITPELLSEHEVDALSIAYVMLQEIRRYPFILYTL